MKHFIYLKAMTASLTFLSFSVFTVKANANVCTIETVEDEVENPTNEPSFTITPTKIEMAAGKVGKTIEVATLHVSSQNMPDDIRLEITGANSNMFKLSQSKIDKATTEADIIVTYTPTEIAKHKAYLIIDCPSVPELYKQVALTAYAIDEQNPPSVTLEPQSLEAFATKAGEAHEQSLTITTANLPDYAYIKVKEVGSFVVSSTMLPRNTTNTIKVTFKPKDAGTYNNAIIISSLGMSDVTIPVTGVATEATIDDTKEGDDFQLSITNPVSMLSETFDNQERNKPLALQGWTNSAIQGKRAWWGYSFLDYDESAGENVAKVTAYDSNLSSSEASPAEMFLVTPALDFLNSKSKMFTFRVRGDYLQDNQTDKLELCYIDMDDEKPYIAPVGGFNMPCTKDESGEWFEYHIDLADQNIANTFFMGFRFTSTRSNSNAATYYIDDVTYGRTDIPVIRTSVAEVAMETTPGKDAYSELITVSSENVSEPIKLKLGGANKSKFKLSTSELAAEGGSFTISFNALDEALYSAYVKLSSRGAADKYIEIAVANSEITGINTLPSVNAHVVVYDLKGNIVCDNANATPAEAMSTLTSGVYIVKTITDSRIMVNKVMMK